MDNNYLTKPEGGDPLNVARQFLQSFQTLMVNYDDMVARLEQSEARNRELEQENERLLGEQQKNGSWASRVTYENVVELIASYEDASQRDEARKLIEPLLKKEQVRQLRRDIKKRVKEQNEDNGIGTFNNYGTYNEVQAGGLNITKGC
jgi:hypothetical protein